MKNIFLSFFLFFGLLATSQEFRFGGATGADNQQIITFSITGDILTLTLEDGGTQTVDLSPYLDNTDNQTVTDLSLTGNTLSITLSGGNTETVDLSDLVFTLQDGSVTPAKLANGSFGDFAVTGGVVTLSQNSVGSLQLEDANVTQSKIANSAVNSDRIENSSIWPIDLNFVEGSNTDGKLVAVNGSNGFKYVDAPSDTDNQNATEVPMTGYVEGSDDSAPDSGDNVAEAIAKLKNITDGISGGSGLTTEQEERIANAKLAKWDSITTNTTLTKELFLKTTTGNRGASYSYYLADGLTVTLPQIDFDSIPNGIRLEAAANGRDTLRTDVDSYFKIAGQAGLYRHEVIFEDWEDVIISVQNDSIYKLTIGAAEIGSYDPIPPAVPTGLTNTDAGSFRLNYSFNSVAGATGYEYDVDDSGSPVDIGDTNTFEITSLTPGTSYNVKVRAYKPNNNNSAYTANVIGTTTADAFPTGNFASTDDANAMGDWTGTTTFYSLASTDAGDSFMGRAIGRSGGGYSTFHRIDLSSVFDGSSTYTITIRASQVQGTNGAIILREEGTSTSLADITVGSALTNVSDTPGFNDYVWEVDSSLSGTTGFRIQVTTTSSTTGNDDGTLDAGEQATDISSVTITKN